MSRRTANLRAIERYVLQVRPARYPGTAGSVVDIMLFTGKPESSPPHSKAGEDHLMSETNSEARRILENIIEHYLRGRYSDSYHILEAAPLEITAWRSWANVEAKEMLWRFGRALLEVEEELERRHPGLRLSVSVNPYDEPVATKREAADKDRSITARDSYRGIVRQLEALEFEGYSREAAKAEMSKRLDCSIARIKKALEFVKQERERAR